MEFASVLVTIGCIVQTASQNIPMFIAGRVIAGVAVGYYFLILKLEHG